MKAHIAIVLLIACGEPKREDTKPPDKPTPGDAATVKTPPPVDATAVAANPHSGLVVTLDGKPTAIQSAIATIESNGQVEVELSNYAYSCKEKVEAFTSRGSQPGDVQFRLRIGKYLHADGKLGWAVRGRYMKGSSQEKEYGGWPLPDTEIDATADKHFELALDYTHETLALEKSPAQKLTVKGPVKVTGCGDSKWKKDPEPAPQEGATIEIAGQSLPIAGAGIMIKKDGGSALQIATHPVKCVDGSDYTSTRADVSIELNWSKAGKLYNVEREGYWVDWANTQADDIKLTAKPNRPPPGAKEMTITLGGSTTIAKYPVALKGKVKAIVCPTPK